MTNWTENYGCHSLRIGGGALTINVNWHKGGYAVSCGNRKLKDVISDLDAAKAAGIWMARQILELAMEDLDKVTEKQMVHGGQHGND